MRSRRPVLLLIVGLLGVAYLSRHILALVRILNVYLFWHSTAQDYSLSNPAFSFDPSFASYPLLQSSADWQTTDPNLLRLVNESYAQHTTSQPDLVPPILHHIFLGKPRHEMPPSWSISRDACLDYHPNYTHHFWDDESAQKFMSSHYPWFLQRWLNYKYPIQRADSLRYFLLHHYGGIFLDLDLECLRSLGPLRQFPVVNIAAVPAGISNGFMMALPQHPFLGQVISALALYDRTWFWIPYAAVMFSTGPMFLSAEHARFTTYHSPGSSASAPSLAVLDNPYHRLSGPVKTPLFRHLGSSSWHNDDAKLLKRVINRRVPVFLFLTLLGVGVVVWFARKWTLSPPKSRGVVLDEEDEALPLSERNTSRSNSESETENDSNDIDSNDSGEPNWFENPK